MDFARLFTTYGFVWSPYTFGALTAVAFWLLWMALAPGPLQGRVKGRLDDYVVRDDANQWEIQNGSLASRTLVPVLRSMLRFLGRLLPGRDAERTRELLEQAGFPLGLSVIDFYGLRILLILLLCGGCVLLLGSRRGAQVTLLALAFSVALGFVLPGLWLNARVKARRRQIVLAFSDALDMLTIGVEAGLAFESAMLRVSEKWDNALTREFRRVVAEMRIGLSRDEALNRMAMRTGVDEVKSFVAVLIQSSALGVSIAQVLHNQAADVRMRRRMQAEEQARKAGTKMIIPLVLLIFPTLFMVILGPAVLTLIETFSQTK